MSQSAGAYRGACHGQGYELLGKSVSMRTGNTTRLDGSLSLAKESPVQGNTVIKTDK